MTRLLVVLLVAGCCAVHCHHLRAPTGWYVGRASPDGSYVLMPVLGRPQDDLLDAQRRREIVGPDAVLGRLHCTNGMVAQQDGLSVWCARP